MGECHDLNIKIEEATFADVLNFFDYICEDYCNLGDAFAFYKSDDNIYMIEKTDYRKRDKEIPYCGKYYDWPIGEIDINDDNHYYIFMKCPGGYCNKKVRKE